MIRRSPTRLAVLVATLLSLALAAPRARAQEPAERYPSRPIRIVVGFGPGGGSDVLARTLGEHMQRRLGQPVVVENRTGAQGNIAMGHVAKAEPDGYTLAMVPVGNAAVNPSLFRSLPYDMARDFAPVSQVATVDNVLVVSAKSPARDLKDLIALGRRPDVNITYASPGAGSQAHLAGELLARAAGMRVTHIPYRGLSPALTDVLSGEVTMTFTQLSLAQPFIDSGALRALGIASRERGASVPALPTIAEAGDLPGFEAVSWYALMAPARTPDAIVRKLAGEVAAVVQLPEVRAALKNQGATPVGGTPEELAQVIRDDTARWSKVIREAGIQVE